MTLSLGAQKAYATIILLMQIGGIFASSFAIVPPVASNSAESASPAEFSARSLGTNCDASYSPTCLKLGVVSFVERLSEKGDLPLFSGLTLVNEAEGDKTKTAEKVAELARSFPNEPEKRLDSYLMFKIGSFLDTHSLKFKLLDDEAKDNLELIKEGEIGRSGDARFGDGGGGGGGGGGGKRRRGSKGGMGGMMAMAMMMKGMVASIALGGLALLAGKALMTSLLALLLSGIIGIKSLLGGGEKQTTYEIVAKPVYSQTHSHSSSHEDVHHGGGGDHHSYGGYGRSLDIQLPEHLKRKEP